MHFCYERNSSFIRHCARFLLTFDLVDPDGGRNCERPIFRNFIIVNVKSYEIQLFDFFIYEIIFSFFASSLRKLFS